MGRHPAAMPPRQDFASVIAALALRLPDMTRLCLVSALQLLHHSAPSHADLMFGCAPLFPGRLDQPTQPAE